MVLTDAERERVRLYGLCPAHFTPRDVREAQGPRGPQLEMFCTACDEGQPPLLG